MANVGRPALVLQRSSWRRCVSGGAAPLVGVHTSAASCDSSPTHTGQAFSPDDYRNARFLAAPRQTNPRWAINLVKEVPPKAVKDRVVACDGAPGALGHPRIYINVDEPGNHACIYCGLRYYKDDSH